MIKKPSFSALEGYAAPLCTVVDLRPQEVLCTSYRGSGIADATEDDWLTL